MSVLVQDGRAIQAAICYGGGGYSTQGEMGVSKIEAYDENGEPWLAIYYQEETEPRERAAARFFVVYYKEPEE